MIGFGVINSDFADSCYLIGQDDASSLHALYFFTYTVKEFAFFSGLELCKNKFTVLAIYGIMAIRRYDHGRTNSYYAAIT